MARSVESQIKRARELARKERRERKQEKKTARQEARRATDGEVPTAPDPTPGNPEP